MTVLVCYNRIYAWPQTIPIYQGGYLEFQNGVILIGVSAEMDTIWYNNFNCNGFYHFLML
jgi:hypothetical protein